MPLVTNSPLHSAARVVVLGTGGTIAGTASDAYDHTGYTAGQIAVADLVASVPALAGQALQCEQVAQLDSRDMDHATWQALALCVDRHLQDPTVVGIVITHGTDTLEETAYFLHSVLCPSKPVMLTCAMRPASALAPDGPQNLADAVVVARSGVPGVMVVCAGTVHVAVSVRKVHTYRLDAFSSGDSGPLAWVEQGELRWASNRALAPVPSAYIAIETVAKVPACDWPRVELVHSHAGVGAAVVDALLGPSSASPLRGLVVAAPGNGSVHAALAAALHRAQAAGVVVLRATRCAGGAVLPAPGADFSSAGALTPVQARIELMLTLLRTPAEP